MFCHDIVNPRRLSMGIMMGYRIPFPVSGWTTLAGARYRDIDWSASAYRAHEYLKLCSDTNINIRVYSSTFAYVIIEYKY